MDADLVPIGEAARRLGIATSALRYYDEREIVRPAARTAGKRRYGVSELRSLAFVQMMQRLGVDLDTIAATLRDTGPPWSAVVEQHLAWLDDRIARAEEARRILRHARSCPHERPWRNCPYLIAVLDNWLRDGAPPQPEAAGSDITDRWPDPWLARLTPEPDAGAEPDPLDRLRQWLAEARATEPDPYAVVVATSVDGAPSLCLRHVERLSDGELEFGSPEAELAARITANPQVALLFPWRGAAREARVAGAARETGPHHYRLRPDRIELRREIPYRTL